MLDVEALEAGRGPPHLGQLIGPRPDGRLALGRQERGADAVVQSLLQRGVQPGRNPSPHDPVIRAAFQAHDRLSRFGPPRRLHHLPELLDPKAVERVAKPRPQGVPDQMIPAAQVTWRAPALESDGGQELPQTAAQPRRPFMTWGGMRSRRSGAISRIWPAWSSARTVDV